MTVYLDHNATTPLDQRVLEAMLPYLTSEFGNPSSVYQLGRAARSAVERAREQVASVVNAHPSQLVFTSGGTEANNLALKGAVNGLGCQRIAVSAIEHASVRDVARKMGASGKRQVRVIPVESDGRVAPDAFAEVLKGFQPELVSVMLANNESGVIQPIEALVKKVPQTIFHTDAVQALGKIPVDFQSLGVSMMTLSAHKIYGPKGVGALIVDKSLALHPLIDGGGQEKSRRSGTENVAAIVGFGKAAELAGRELETRGATLQKLRDRLQARLKNVAGITIISEHAERLPNTVFMTVAGIDSETLLMALDSVDIAVASGSACASKTGKGSHVLLAMGIDEALAKNAIRLSVGVTNTEAEIDQFIVTLVQLTASLKSMSVMSRV